MTTAPTPNEDDDEELGRAARVSCVAVGFVFLGLAAFLSAHIVRAAAIDVTVIGLTILTGAGLILLALGLRQLGDGGLWSLSGLFYAGVARLLIGVREHVQWVLGICANLPVGLGPESS